MRIVLKQKIKLAFVIILTGLFAGCSTFTKSSNEGGDVVNSASDIVNRAPDHLSPPADIRDGKQVIDSMYMQTKADYHYSLGESYSLEGKPNKAIEQFKLTLVYDTKSSNVRLRLAREFVKVGLISEAIRLTKESIALQSNNIDAHLLLGGLYSSLRLFGKALEEYEIVMALDSKNEDAPVYMGAIYVEQRQFDKAIDYFDKLAKNKKYKSKHLAYYYKGRVHLEKGASKNVKAAQEAFEKAVELKPSFVDAVLSLSEIFEETGQRPKTLELLSGYQERYGPSMTVADQLGRIYMESNELKKAYEQFEIIEQGDPDNLNVKIKMAFILIDQERYPLAISRLEDILAKAPFSDKVRFYLGAVYEETKEYDKAIVQFKKIKPESVYYAESVVHASYLHKLLGDYNSAIAVIQNGLKYTKDNPQFYALYASYLDELKKYDLAVELLGEAVERFPKNPQLRFFLGSMWDRKGEVSNTIASMKIVLDIDSNHVQALNYLAYTYAENGLSLDEAESLVRRALKLQPNDGYILDTLGWIQFKRGDLETAIKTLETAHRLQSNEAIIAEHLADAYSRFQLNDRALRMYQIAERLEKDSTKLARIRQKMNRVEMMFENTSQVDRLPASSK